MSAALTSPVQRESAILRDVLVAVTALPDAMFYRNNVGVAVTQRGAVVRFGLPGSADIMGTHRGRAVAIETKTRRGALSDDQRRFRARWTQAGGLYIVARSAAEALAALSDAGDTPCTA